MKTDCRDPRWHLLYVDILLAKGEMGTLPNVAAGVPFWFKLCVAFTSTIKHCSLTVILTGCCYGPFDPGEAKAAGTHLCQVFGQEPRDAVAQARVGVVEALQQNYRSAVHRLSKLTEKDSCCLDFLLTLIPSNQRQTVAQVASHTGHFDAHLLIKRTTNVITYLCSR